MNRWFRLVLADSSCSCQDLETTHTRDPAPKEGGKLPVAMPLLGAPVSSQAPLRSQGMLPTGGHEVAQGPVWRASVSRPGGKEYRALDLGCYCFKTPQWQLFHVFLMLWP